MLVSIRAANFSLINNESGQNVLGVTMVIAATAVIGILLMALKGANISKLVLLQTKSYSTIAANQRAMALGAYLVGNNLILCKQSGWVSVNPTTKPFCIWGGEYHSPKSIEASTYEIIKTSYQDRTLILEYKPKIAKVTTKIYFTLEDMNTSSTLKKLAGDAAKLASISSTDQDSFLVVMRAVTLNMEDKEDISFGAIRRPLANPQMEIDPQAACDFSCISGITENSSPECRGPQEVPGDGKKSSPIKIRNAGPGAIYELKIKKIVSFSPKYYGNKPTEVSYIQAIGGGVIDEVLMPGNRPKELGDALYCIAPVTLPPITATQTTTGYSNSTTTSTAVNVHGETASTFGYYLPVVEDGKSMLEPARILLPVVSQTGTSQAITNQAVTTVKVVIRHSH